MLNDYGKINWLNLWRIALILLGFCVFFFLIGDASKSPIFNQIAAGFGIPGAMLFIVMFVVRFEDVQKFMDDKKGLK
jgi:Mn2+/Fe2+ NRAMP family transporter